MPSETIIKKENKSVIVSVNTGELTADENEKSLDELERLIETAGGVVIARMTQNLESPNTATVIGKGKLQELSELCENNDIELVVFDTELSPSQIRNIEDALKDVRVIDRSMLILDIFALHAVTGEGKLQVELAQLKYTAPRLIGKGLQLSRLGGGIGTRGPGESKLESDRRHIKRRIAALESEIKELDKTRMTMRAARDKSGITKIAIVGYTNAGKSTLLNRLTNAGILAENKLFATLDPTTRKFKLESGESVLLTDTVGFIRKLPHHLISAFKSTLDEVVYADILAIVIDASDPEHEEQLKVTEQLLSELGAGDKPRLYLFNKCDLSPLKYLPNIDCERKNIINISSLTGEGIELFVKRVEEIIHEQKKLINLVIPNDKLGLLDILYKNSAIINIEYEADGAHVSAVADSKVRGMLAEYIIDDLTTAEEEFDE